MHIGLSRPPVPPHPYFDVDAAAVAVIAEELGFESVFYGEHPVTPVGEAGQNVHLAGVPFFQDQVVALARASAVTKRIKLGAGVCVIPLHNPIMLAKHFASIDYYSGGRLIVGVGFGWSRAECEVMGGNFDRRFGQAREAVQLMKLLWSQDAAEFHGEFFDVPPLALQPRPVQQPGPPVLLPGPRLNDADPLDSERYRAAFKRIVDYADGWIPGFVGPREQAQGPQRLRDSFDVLAKLCGEIGRDPAELSTTVILRLDLQDGDMRWPELPSRYLVRQYADVGVERALVTIPTITDEAHAREVITRLAEALL